MDGTIQKINKETENVNNTIDWLDVTDMYTSQPPNNSRKDILPNYPWNILHNRPHVGAQNKFKKTEVIKVSYLTTIKWK